MTQEMQSQIETLLKAWHEAGRAEFVGRYENLDYDSASYAKTYNERRKYVALDSGSSGAFLVNKNTGEVFTIKAYGVPKHRLGHISYVSGLALYDWRPY